MADQAALEIKADTPLHLAPPRMLERLNDLEARQKEIAESVGMIVSMVLDHKACPVEVLGTGWGSLLAEAQVRLSAIAAGANATASATTPTCASTDGADVETECGS